MKHKILTSGARIFMAATLFAALVSSCGEASFKIDGDIKDADNKSVVLEKSDFHGRWIAIDSTRTASSGHFSFKCAAPQAPEIYRLALDGKYIYLPIDSVETVNVSSSLSGFGSDFSLSGSDKAVALAQFEKELMALPSSVNPDSLDSFKRSVYSKYMRDAQGSIVAYYILTKTVDGKPLFNPDTDYKYFAAVATGFKERRPNDPRSQLLEQTSIEALKKRNRNSGKRIEVQAEEISVIDIALPDENGTERKLSEMVGKGKPTVVVFSLLTHPNSPALNLELSKLYNSGNVNFYHVSLDPDQYAWRDAARNLPWTTVFDAEGNYSKAAAAYNVSDLPTFFIYNGAGELTSRAASVDELRRHL